MKPMWKPIEPAIQFAQSKKHKTSLSKERKEKRERLGKYSLHNEIYIL